MLKWGRLKSEMFYIYIYIIPFIKFIVHRSIKNICYMYNIKYTHGLCWVWSHVVKVTELPRTCAALGVTTSHMLLGSPNAFRGLFQATWRLRWAQIL